MRARHAPPARRASRQARSCSGEACGGSGDLDEAGWQRRLFDDAAPPEPPVEFPYAAYAELIGLRGIRVDHPQGVGPAWAAALGSDMPTLVEMVTDPRVPPLPPHASPEQLRTWRDAILSGTA